MSLLVFKGVTKSYNANDIALRKINFELAPGEFAALSGPSGSGKSTVLYLAAGLDIPTQGSVHLLGRDLKKLSPQEMSNLRRHAVGFIFQAYNLFPVLTAIENVEYPLALQGVSRRDRGDLAKQALNEVGMAKFAKRRPNQLSGGQQQRVAIARAMVTEPKIIFADEPTANLDSKTSERLLELFGELNANHNITFLFSTHDPKILSLVKRVIEVADGEILKDHTKKAA